MANNYTQFSEVLPQLTDEEAKWLDRQLKQIAVIDGLELVVDDFQQLPVGEETYRGYRLWRDVPDTEGIDDREYLGFECSIEDDSDHPDGWGKHLWIYAEESGDPYSAGLAVQRFLKQFRPDESWSLTFGCGCSKPRVGEFDGGGVFVTADEIKCQNGSDFIAACEQELKGSRSGAKPK